MTPARSAAARPRSGPRRTSPSGWRPRSAAAPSVPWLPLDPHDRSSVSAFVRREGRGVVATATRQGRPEAALVGLVALDDGTLIVNCGLRARKLSDLATNELVAVVVGVGGDVSVQVEGTATVARGEERERYGSEYDRQRPGSRALHPHFAVVVVRPAWIRVYDTSTAPASVTEADWSGTTPGHGTLGS